MAKAQKRLSQLEALNIFTLEQGQPISERMADRMIKRGLAFRQNGRLVPTEEARAAFRRWSGT